LGPIKMLQRRGATRKVPETRELKPPMKGGGGGGETVEVITRKAKTWRLRKKNLDKKQRAWGPHDGEKQGTFGRSDGESGDLTIALEEGGSKVGW